MSEIEIIIPDWDVPAEIIAGVSTRAGGASRHPYDSLNLAHHVGDSAARVNKNLRLLSNRYPQHLQWQWLRQTHGIDVHRADACCGPVTADGICTSVLELACCVLTADCMPVLFAARDGGEIALAHAGWRGLVAGILECTIAKCSTSAQELMAWLGPAIGPCHFKVGAEVKAAFLAIAGDLEEREALQKYFKATAEPGKYLCDLYGIARFKLTQSGIARIYGGQYCTFCEPELFYSYRRDDVTGRMASFIYIRKPHQK
jgi:YfiH family protein